MSFRNQIQPLTDTGKIESGDEDIFDKNDNTSRRPGPLVPIEEKNERAIKEMQKQWCMNLAELAAMSQSDDDDANEEAKNDKFEELTKDLDDRDLIKLWRQRVNLIKGSTDDVSSRKEEVDALVFGYTFKQWNARHECS